MSEEATAPAAAPVPATVPNQSQKKLNLMAGRDASGTSLDKLHGYSTTVIKKVFDEGKPIILTGTEQGEAMGSQSIVAGNIRSIMAVPLRVRDKILGVVYIDSRMTKGLFNEEDLGIFSAIANNIAVSIQLAQARRVEKEKEALQKQFEIQAAIAEVAKKVENLVDNMQQALFSIDKSGIVIEPVSKVSTSVFGMEIVGKSIFDTLYQSIPRKSETYSMIETAVSTVFGEDELQWSLMEDSFPQKVEYKMGEDVKIFKLSTRPLYDEKAVVDKIMFVVDDITDVEKLEKAIREQTARIQILQQVADVEKFELIGFFEDSTKLIVASELELEKGSPDTSTLILRNLHTLKGNSRLLSFTKMAALVHDLEDKTIQMTAAKMPAEEFEQNMTKIFASIREVLEEYKDVAKKYLGIGATNDQTIEVPLVNVQSLRESLNAVKPKLSEEQYDRMSDQIENLAMPPLKVIFMRYENMVREISTSLGKSAALNVKGGDFAVAGDVLEVLRNSIVHLLRNSLDHGLEEPAKREPLGKPATGQILIDIQRSPQELIVSLKDDGKGIDGNQIARVAVTKGLIKEEKVKTLSDIEKVNLIMLQGFSTKETATDLSGRGVGMDAVKAFVEGLDGTFEIGTVLGKGSTFTIRIPTVQKIAKLKSS